MKDLSISLLTICGLAELEQHGSSGVTHVLSILDPDRADPDDFAGYDRHHRTTLRFHDIIQPMGEMILPEPKDVEAVLKFGEELTEQGPADDAHVLVHCHMGVSRSTAAMTTLLCQLHPQADEDEVFAHLRSIRPQIWPNSRMIGFCRCRARQGRQADQGAGAALRPAARMEAGDRQLHGKQWPRRRSGDGPGGRLSILR